MQTGLSSSRALQRNRNTLPHLPPRTVQLHGHHPSTTPMAIKSSRSCRVRMEKPCLECPICIEMFAAPVKTSCGHVFCFLCLFHPDVQNCPVCRSPISLATGDFQYDSFSELNVKIFGTEEATQSRKHSASSRNQSFASAWRRHYRAPIFFERNGELHLDVETILKTFHDEELGQSDPMMESTNMSELRFRKKLMVYSHVEETSEVYFENGYMKRRAPSIVVLRGQDENFSDAKRSVAQRKKPRGAVTCPSGRGDSKSEQHNWRLDLSNRVALCLSTRSDKLPILTDRLGQTDDDGDVVRFTVAEAQRNSSGKDTVCVDTNDFVTVDDGDAEVFDSEERSVAEFRHLQVSKQQHQSRIMSADTRLQSDLRSFVKSQSRLACLTNAKAIKK